MTYRDEHQAALNRAAALEAELSDLQIQHGSDAQRIAELEKKLATARTVLAQHGTVLDILPSSANKVLIFGILGLVFCQILGPVAWALGRQELRRIDAGKADASKRGTAQAGMVLGILGTVFLGFYVFMLLCCALAG